MIGPRCLYAADATVSAPERLGFLVATSPRSLSVFSPQPPPGAVCITNFLTSFRRAILVDRPISSYRRRDAVWAINAGGGIGAHRQTDTLSGGGTNLYHVRCVRSGAATAWIPIVGPYSSTSGNFEYLDTSVPLQPVKFYRLRYAGSNGIPPLPPRLSFRKETTGAVLYWQTNFTGFTLEYARNSCRLPRPHPEQTPSITSRTT